MEIDLSPWKNVKEWYDRLQTFEAIATIHQKFREGAPATREALAKIPISE
jgi:hypothetical protein